MSQRHLKVDLPHLLSVGDTDRYLNAALEDIVTNYPPRSRYPPDALHGLWGGPTGVAYLLLQVSAHRPELIIRGHPAADWARAYIAPGSRGHSLRLGSHGCGLSDEKLAYEAVRCAVSADLADVRQLLSSVSQLMAVSDDDYPDEMLYGRAGTLYLLRMVRRWVPGSSDLVDPAVAEISNTVLARGPRWRWHGKRYLGAVHGDVGIVTQLVLTSPELAPRLQPAVEKLLGMQREDGNWPSSEESNGHGGKGLVQFCHGATGFVLSLAALRPHFPDLHAEFYAAIRKGRECIWSQGLLKKEPCLCHGIFGNALALASGPQRDHFLAIATPENVARMKKSDPSVFERADYGRSYSTTSSYAPSAVWTWLVRQEQEPRMLGYSDV
ncbi:hypothetical protein N658DRAFT_436818 [Parathielavia hyrcaniae]|uniref:LanC-like protein 2 n=1 Tax=Parathielavia hyrcaniae TaxID=113614 RepID=A0AAN6SX56_9PEZI|nr:hypothetical protein N658DRAFT_436818 [Parathielavia hyrcaniae]